jgi:hypothetical protein
VTGETSQGGAFERGGAFHMPGEVVGGEWASFKTSVLVVGTR